MGGGRICKEPESAGARVDRLPTGVRVCVSACLASHLLVMDLEQMIVIKSEGNRKVSQRIFVLGVQKRSRSSALHFPANKIACRFHTPSPPSIGALLWCISVAIRFSAADPEGTDALTWFQYRNRSLAYPDRSRPCTLRLSHPEPAGVFTITAKLCLTAPRHPGYRATFG